MGRTENWFVGMTPMDLSQNGYVLNENSGKDLVHHAMVGALERIARALEDLADPDRRKRMERSARARQSAEAIRDRHEEAFSAAYQRICNLLPNAKDRVGVSSRVLLTRIAKRLGFKKWEWAKNAGDHAMVLQQIAEGEVQASDLARPGSPKHARIEEALKRAQG